MDKQIPRIFNYSFSRFKFFIFLFGLLAALCPSVAAQTAEPSTKPILRIETGMHTAKIKRIGIDAANRYLVTASHDKTVRVWELSTGHLLRVLRPPIGEGDEGKMYAVAISPDGQTVVASGWTAYDWDGTNSLYFFDRESGRLIRRISGLPNAVSHLVYSHDGKYLAVTLLLNNGVRVYDTANFTMVGEDDSYADSSYGADFDAANRLVTTSLDGFVRLYNFDDKTSLRLVAKSRVSGGKQPLSISFSPDSSKVAVGFADSLKVNVLSGKDLSKTFSPDTTGINDLLPNVVWSSDGATLYAGGLHKANGIYIIRAWDNAGRGRFQDIPAAGEEIQHIVALSNGGIAYGTGDPAFGALDVNGKRLLFRSPSIVNFTGIGKELLLSFDGTTVQFNYEQNHKSFGQFSTTSLALREETSSEASLEPPITKAQPFNFNYDNGAKTISLNGNLLPLEYNQNESIQGHGLAISPDRKHVLIGTSYYIRVFDKEGNELWKVTVPAVVWGVNISGNGEFAVAAYGDGTIRWYRMIDGKELLDFFPHIDRQRWVLWTPSGYYSASPGGEEFIGWHLNNGKDSAADFFPVKQVESFFKRPDVVTKILKTKDEAEAIKLANRGAGRQGQSIDVARVLPPVVEILSPKDGVEVIRGEATVRFKMRTPSGEPVTEVKALVDGRPVVTAASQNRIRAGQDKDVKEIKVSLSENASQISIIAENRFSASVPATVTLRRKTIRP
jgi:WD40 repeat protein